MRPVNVLAHNGEVTLCDIVEDTALDFIDSHTEANSDYISLSTTSTENKMATVFPSSASSGNAVTSANKNVISTNTQTKSDRVVENAETVVMHSTNAAAAKESYLSLDQRNKKSYILQRNNNNTFQSEVRNDKALSGTQDCRKSDKVSAVTKGRSSSSFHDRIVEAFIEQPKAAVIDKTEDTVLKNGENLCSDKCGKQNLGIENSCAKNYPKISLCNLKSAEQTVQMPPNSSSRTQAPTSATTTKTRSDCGDPLVSSEKTHSLTHNGYVNEKPDRGQSSSLSVQSDCPSPVDFQLRTTTDTSGKQRQIHVSQGAVTTCDDAITTEVTVKLPESEKINERASPGQDGGGEGRQRLSTRISKTLVNFFQRLPGSSSASTDSPNAECQRRRVASPVKKTHRKDSSRQTSFAGKLMTSVTEWRRKPPKRTRSRSQERNKKDSNVEDKNEVQNNNTGRIPLFVLPQDQDEIVEDAPEAIMEEQKGILRESWLVIKSDVAEVGVETFMGLFHTHPDSIDSFLAFKDKAVEDIEQSAVLKAHALRVMQTVDKCITRLDQVDKMASVLSQLGRRHIGYQANASLVPIIGKQFISAIEPKMADKWSDDVHKAWDILFRTINYNLRLGMMHEKHRLEDEAATRKK